MSGHDELEYWTLRYEKRRTSRDLRCLASGSAGLDQQRVWTVLYHRHLCRIRPRVTVFA